jgi:hypothetical protein
MSLLDALQLMVVTIVAIWGIYQTRVTNRLAQQVHRLNTGLEQSIQILHRAREAVIKIHAAYVFLLEYRSQISEPTEIYITKFAEMSANQAELRGLAFAIGDKDLLALVNEGYRFREIPSGERNTIMDEMEIRGRSQKLHTRISELLKLITK